MENLAKGYNPRMYLDCARIQEKFSVHLQLLVTENLSGTHFLPFNRLSLSKLENVAAITGLSQLKSDHADTGREKGGKLDFTFEKERG